MKNHPRIVLQTPTRAGFAVVVAAITVAVAFGCEETKPDATPESVPAKPEAQPDSPVPPPSTEPPMPATSAVEYLDQGWDAEIREAFYWTAQGSRLYPHAWFLALERAEDTKRFASAQNLARFGWIISPPTTGSGEFLNPDGLPIGFVQDVKDVPKTGEWVGLTCAACHTNQLEINGNAVRIDGGGSYADLDSFMAAFSDAISATDPDTDREKFARFASAANVGEQAIEPAAFEALFREVNDEVQAVIRHGTPTHPGGPGRIDALGKIVNAMAVDALGVESNHRVPNAPVSTPSVWVSPHMDFVQWNPVAANVIARNAGEVLGVFGALNLGRQPPSVKLAADEMELLDSSVLYDNLAIMEKWLGELQPPRWPDHLVAAEDRVDETRARRGKEIYEKNCLKCHTMPPFERTNVEDNIAGLQFIKTWRQNFKNTGTDEEYVTQFLGLTSDPAAPFDLLDAGPLAPVLGKPKLLRVEFFTGGVRSVIEAEAAAQTLRNISDGMSEADAKATTTKKFLALSGYRADRSGNPWSVPVDPRTGRQRVDDLKAAPLLGIWATAPYLHNGSVPTLDDLLKPPDQRPKTFWVGGRGLDTVKLGIETDPGPRRVLFDTSVAGNHNGGHAYPKQPLDDASRSALLEFLKDPQRFLPEDPILSGADARAGAGPQG